MPEFYTGERKHYSMFAMRKTTLYPSNENTDFPVSVAEYFKSDPSETGPEYTRA